MPRRPSRPSRQRYAPQALHLDRTDGVSFEFPDWRFNLRTSNTEPLIRLNVEARGSVKLMQAKTAELLDCAEIAGRGRRGSLNKHSVLPSQTQRRDSGLQRRGGAADACSRGCIRRSMRCKIPYEIVFVNDGSKDRSVALLRQQFSARPQETRVVLFHANFGQHSAVMAGLAYARGEYVVTLDADLQNPPEEIGKLVAKLDQGYDYVGTIRQQRQDSLWRRSFSKAINKIREWITPVRITDQGCMMRGYARSVVDGAQSDPRSQHLHSGAGVFVRHEAHRGAHRARGAIRRALEIFDVQFDPPEFRFDHRLFRGAAAAVFHDRHAGRAALGVAVRGAARAPHLRRLRGRRLVHPVQRRVSLHRRGACSASACWASTSGASMRRCASGRATSWRRFWRQSDDADQAMQRMAWRSSSPQDAA